MILEFSRSGLILLGPRQALIYSEPRDQSAPKRHVARFEWSAGRLGVYIDGQPLYEGVLAEPLSGSLHPGVIVSGGSATGIVIQRLRVEQ